MRLPSSAQAALLSCIGEHERDDEYVLAYEGGEARGTKIGLVLERDDHGPLLSVQHFVSLDPGLATLVPASLEFPRRATFDACIRNEWITLSDHVVTVTSQRLGRCFTLEPKTYELGQLNLTEDGLLALNVWRQRKLAEPPADPALEGRDREIVALAEHAVRLGFRLAPRTDEAKKDARRLRREGWVVRGHIGASTSSVVPTAMGAVEVNPGAADRSVVLLEHSTKEGQ